MIISWDDYFLLVLFNKYIKYMLQVFVEFFIFGGIFLGNVSK